MSYQQPRMRADTFNLIVAAVVMILVATVTVLVMLFGTPVSCNEKKKQVNVTEAPPVGNVAHRLTDVRQGTTVRPSADTPWRREEVRQVATQVMSPEAFYSKEVPYLMAKPSVMARPETLFALAELSRAMPEMPGVRLYLESGYLTWEAAESEAGESLFHTGYTIRIALAVEEGVLSLSDALSHPAAAAPAAWLNVNFTRYGFIAETHMGEGCISYIGLPHTRVMDEMGVGADAYLTRMRAYSQQSPYVYTSGGETIHLFYLPADYGAVTLYVREGETVLTTGDGSDGFLVAVWQI